MAHVTFVDGGIADTVRREGRLTRRGLYFELVGGGTLVLTLESGDGSPGEFAGGPDVPVRFGLLDLTRKAESGLLGRVRGRARESTGRAARRS